MGFIDAASNISQSRGYDYFKNKKVVYTSRIDHNNYFGRVIGTDGITYEVTIDMLHPRKSKCNCPHADGRRIVCKHMVALFFSIEPQALREYEKEIILSDEEIQKQKEIERKEIEKKVKKLSKKQLRSTLIEMMMNQKDRGM